MGRRSKYCFLEYQEISWARWLRAIVPHLLDGGIAILPTETGYMMAVDAYNPEALDALYEAKGRPAKQPTHLAVSDCEAVHEILDLSPELGLLLERYAPGPLTVVAEPKVPIHAKILAGGGTLGVRVPQHRGTNRVLEALGRPLTATSANRAGEPHRKDLKGILAQFPKTVADDWFLLEDDRRLFEVPSTLVSWPGELQVIREGAISEADLRKVLQSPSGL